MSEGDSKNVKKIFLLALFIFIPSIGMADSNSETVYIIPVENEVERGLEAFLKRSIREAEKQKADRIILEIHTPGGFVHAAGNIAHLLRKTKIKTTAFIKKDALSAGAYIALNADEIVMAPGSRIGSAAIIDQEGNMADEKMRSAWLADMKASAELNGRDPMYALAMADPEIDLPEYGAEKGKLLTLTASQALAVGYAEAIVADRNELMAYLNMENAKIIESELTISERIARFVTHPVIVPILLTLASLGLVLELYSPGFGIPGFIGLASLFLYFFGHMLAGFAGWEALILLLAGLILLFIEIFTPGFGIFGISGIVSIFISIFLSSSAAFVDTLLYITIAMIATLAVSALYIRFFGYQGFLKKLVLADNLSTDLGYVANETNQDIVGQIGMAATPLRPSGRMELNGKFYDVVSEAGFVEQGKPVVVVESKGSRIIVYEVKE